MVTPAGSGAAGRQGNFVTNTKKKEISMNGPLVSFAHLDITVGVVRVVHLGRRLTLGRSCRVQLANMYPNMVHQAIEIVKLALLVSIPILRARLNVLHVPMVNMWLPRKHLHVSPVPKASTAKSWGQRNVLTVQRAKHRLKWELDMNQTAQIVLPGSMLPV